MSGPKRNPDRLNTIGVVVVGICGAVLVYVTIVALQAFYVDDTSEIQMMADYGGQDTQAKNSRTQQTLSLNSPSSPNPRPVGMPQTYRIPLKHAMKYVVDGAKTDPANLVPAHGRSDKPTVKADFGRPKPLDTASPPAGAGSAAAPDPAAPAAPAGAGSAGAGSAAPAPAPTPAPNPTPARTPAPTGGPAGTPPKQPAATTPPPARTAPAATGSAAPKGNGR
jgi:hypothetical protein